MQNGMPKNFLFPKTEPPCRNQPKNTMAFSRRAKRGGCLWLVFFSSVDLTGLAPVYPGYQSEMLTAYITGPTGPWISIKQKEPFFKDAL